MTELAIRVADFDSPAVQSLLAEWNEELRATVPGYSPIGGSRVQASDFGPPDGAFLMAESDGETIGCGGLRRLTQSSGEVKRLYVRPNSRGQGVGRSLLLELEAAARESGFAQLRLDTHGGERSPAGFFRSLGYGPIEDYNGNPYARFWFEKRLAVSA